jgi:hypothetical protein
VRRPPLSTLGAFCGEWLGWHAVGKSAIEAGPDRPRLVRVGMCQMYGPAARRKTDFQDDEREVLHQCILGRPTGYEHVGEHELVRRK